MKYSYSHIINPYKPPTETEGKLHRWTLASILRAQQQVSEKFNLKITAICNEGEPLELPDGIHRLNALTRTVNDIAVFSNKRPYPLLQDILLAAKDQNTADYIIYSNMDILLQPYFYEVVNELLEQGHDALMINRMRVPQQLLNTSVAQALAWQGKPHPGFDCFVFPRAWIDQMHLANICVGIPFVGVTLAHNIFALSKNLKVVTRQQLTAHIGMEVMPSRSKEYYEHNKKAFAAIKKALKPKLSQHQLPYSAYGFPKRLVKRALNPSIMTSLNLELEAKGVSQTVKRIMEEIRFSLTRDKY